MVYSLLLVLRCREKGMDPFPIFNLRVLGSISKSKNFVTTWKSLPIYPYPI